MGTSTEAIPKSGTATKSDDTVDLTKRVAHNATPGSADFEYPELVLSTSDQPVNAVTKESKHVLVIGSGVSGLYVAWMLLDKGYRNNDFTKSRMTSQIAGALWEFPPGGCGLTEIESPGPGWAGIEHYREWALQSYEFYERYLEVLNAHDATGHSFGLTFTDLHQFFYTDLMADEDDVNYEEYMKLRAIELAANEGRMKKPTTYNEASLEKKFKVVRKDFQGQTLKSAYSHSSPIINTDKAMAYLMALVKAKGANMETRKFTEPIEDVGGQLLKDLAADAIVNATGLGAKELAKDDNVYPVRGAIRRVENTRKGQFRHLKDAYLVPAQLDSNQHPTKTIFIVPRNDDVLYVGSIIQPNHYNKTLTPDSPEVQVMWDRAGEFMPSLRHAGFFPGYGFAQGLRPFTKRNVKVRADEKAKFPLVHNYGHGGSGWTLGIGTARCAVIILEDLLQAEDNRLGSKAELVRQGVFRLSSTVKDLEQILADLEKSDNNAENVEKGLDKATAKLVLSKKIVKKTLSSLEFLEKSVPSLSLGESFKNTGSKTLDKVLDGISAQIEAAKKTAKETADVASQKEKGHLSRVEIFKEAKKLTNEAREMLRDAEKNLPRMLSETARYDIIKLEDRASSIQNRAKTINGKIYGTSPGGLSGDASGKMNLTQSQATATNETNGYTTHDEPGDGE